MPEAISTQNLVVLPITGQELGRGASLPYPNQGGTYQIANRHRAKRECTLAFKCGTSHLRSNSSQPDITISY